MSPSGKTAVDTQRLQDAMIRHSIAAFLLLAVCSVAPYPRFEKVVRSPKDYDLLYGSTSGSHNETWFFSREVNLTSIIIPSKINFCSKGPWTDKTYDEAVDLFLYETKLASSPSLMVTNLMAHGFFNGTVTFGQELEIPLRNTTRTGEPPLVQKYVSSYTGYKYTLNIVFRTEGVYPWYTTRSLSTESVVHSGTNGPGIAIGLAYTTN